MGPVQGQYVSSYFAVPKSKRVPDKWRPILNLTKFNKYVCYVYFHMEDIKMVRKWFQKGSMCLWGWISRLPFILMKIDN